MQQIPTSYRSNLPTGPPSKGKKVENKQKGLILASRPVQQKEKEKHD